jgi:hypothetical protein
MTLQEALKHIYTTSLNSNQVKENVKNLTYIKHILADTTDHKDDVSTMLAMLTKVNFVDQLYHSSNRSVDAKQITNFLSQFFIEKVVIQTLNFHLKALNEPLIQLSQTKTQLPNQAAVPVINSSKEQLAITNLDTGCLLFYTQAKKTHDPNDILTAIAALTQLDTLIESFKKTFGYPPQVLNFKRPRSNITYLQNFQKPVTPSPAGGRYYGPDYVFHPTDDDLNSGVIAFLIVSIISSFGIWLFPNIWQLFAVLTTFTTIGFIISFFATVNDGEISLSQPLYLVISLIIFFIFGPSLSTLFSSWPTLLSITLGLAVSVVLLLVFVGTYESSSSVTWTILTILMILLGIFFFTQTWVLFIAIISLTTAILSIWLSFYEVFTEYNDGGWFGFIIVIVTAFIAYFNFFPNHYVWFLNLM